ncbi:unnamed protein product [Linum tenue]|uniref:Diacylglycerol O-acyltransferase n=1 Tax=Linum tenue TaxID=586396 RepID=A0AAV0Q7D0_9ROSI|nr:unnamed protein product [Linum tenue]
MAAVTAANGKSNGGAKSADFTAVEIGEALSPTASLFHSPKLNCCIIAVLGSKTAIDPAVVKSGLERTLIRHPRFSSRLVVDDHGCRGRKLRWEKTMVELDDHIIIPNLDDDDGDGEIFTTSPDSAVEDYISRLSTFPMDVTKPLWELHILNVKTRDAESLFVFKIHHSIGDGASLISLLLACARKSSDPNALPSVPVKNRRARRQGVVSASGFCCVVLERYEDSDQRSGDRGGAEWEAVCASDGENQKNEEKQSNQIQKSYLPSTIRLRACIMVNMRPTTGIQDMAKLMAKGPKAKWGWGNWIGNMMIPLTIALRDDPLDYLWSAKATMDRKKHSLEPILEFIGARILPMVFGVKATVGIFHKILSNTTLAFSNVVGPVEEISLYGHPIAYIAPSVYGHPHALTIHFQSYCNMMTISVAVDPEVIPDPHVLFDELEQSLIIMKGDVTLKFPKKGPNVALLCRRTVAAANSWGKKGFDAGLLLCRRTAAGTNPSRQKGFDAAHLLCRRPPLRLPPSSIQRRTPQSTSVVRMTDEKTQSSNPLYRGNPPMGERTRTREHSFHSANPCSAPPVDDTGDFSPVGFFSVEEGAGRSSPATPRGNNDDSQGERQ